MPTTMAAAGKGTRGKGAGYQQDNQGFFQHRCTSVAVVSASLVVGVAAAAIGATRVGLGQASCQGENGDDDALHACLSFWLIEAHIWPYSLEFSEGRKRPPNNPLPGPEVSAKLRRSSAASSP